MIRAMSTTPGDRLRKARKEAGFRTATDAANSLGISRDTYLQHENGTRAYDDEAAVRYAKKFKTTAAYLRLGVQVAPTLVPIIGLVGANAEGDVIFTTGQATGDKAPIPPGGDVDSVALEVRGHSMRGLADNGSLIYFSDQRTPPTPDMINHVAVVETEDGQVLIKRLLRGTAADVFDLESLNGPTLQDQRLTWAAHVTAIVPPHQARRIIVRGDN